MEDGRNRKRKRTTVNWRSHARSRKALSAPDHPGAHPPARRGTRRHRGREPARSLAEPPRGRDLESAASGAEVGERAGIDQERFNRNVDALDRECAGAETV